MEPSTIGPHGNVYLEDNQVVDASTPLLPFRKTPAEFWSFNDCRETAVLGYTYPETQRWKHGSDEAYRNDITSTISTLYGGSARAKLMTQHVTAGSQMLLSHNNSFTDWTIESSVAASKFPNSFVVSFSLVSLFQSDPSVDVGNWMVLMPAHKNDVHTSRRPTVPVSEKRLNGTTSITSHLIDRVNAGVLGSLEPGDVVPYLKEYLTWNVYRVCLCNCLGVWGANADRMMGAAFPKSSLGVLWLRFSVPGRIFRKMGIGRLSIVMMLLRILRLWWEGLELVWWRPKLLSLVCYSWVIFLWKSSWSIFRGGNVSWSWGRAYCIASYL
jgi:hypothetical protein